MYLEKEVSVLRAHMNCLQKTSIIQTNPKQIITLSPSVKSSGCALSRPHGESGNKVIECNSGRILRSNQDQEWYFAVSSCGSPSGLTLDYTIIMYGLKGECPKGSNNAITTYHFPSSTLLFFIAISFTLVHIGISQSLTLLMDSYIQSNRKLCS